MKMSSGYMPKTVIGWTPEVAQKNKKKSVKILPQASLKGKFIKFNVREVPSKEEGQPGWVFYSGMLAVDKEMVDKLGRWLDALGYSHVDLLPWFVSEKEYRGQKQTSYIVNFDIKGENVDNKQELSFLEQLSDIKAPVTCDVGAEVEEFTDKKGEEKRKLKFQLIYNTTFQQVQQMERLSPYDNLSDTDTDGAPLKKSRGRPSKKQKNNNNNDN